MLMQSISTIIVGVTVGMLYGWKLALCLIAFGPVVVVTLSVFMKKITRFHIGNHINYIKAGALVEQALASIRTVLSFGGVEYEMKEYETLLNVSLRQAKKLSLSSSLLMGIFIALIFVNYSLGFWVGSIFVQNEVTATNGRPYTAGVVIVCFFSSMMGVFSLSTVTTNLNPINQARISAYDILQMIRRKPAIDYTKYSPELKSAALTGQIEFRDVRFAYPTRPNIEVLKGLSLFFERGRTTAIVGHTGSGKSTIVTLIERLYEPTSGEIFLDSSPLCDHDMKNVRSQIGYVGQEPVLYNQTIRENVLLGSSKPDQVTSDDV